MKRHQNIDILIPNFESGEILEYEISKMETFRFKDSYSKPFKRNYLIELRKIEERKYEVYYPKSVLSASKHFNSLDRFLTKMRNAQNSTIYVSINMEDELELENHKEIQLNLKKLKKELIEQKLQRMKLPEQHVSYIIDAPEEKKVILDISQEKGIRFLFPTDTTTQEYRERFIRGGMVDFAANIIPLRQHNAPIDEKIEPNSYNWFNFMSRVVKEKEEKGELKEHQIGLIEFNTQLN